VRNSLRSTTIERVAAHWNAFGLNMADAVGIPEVPEELTVP